MVEKSNFFGNFYGSISGLSFYARVPQQRHQLLLLHLLLLAAVLTAGALTPFARHLAVLADRYVSFYDERFPEIHVLGKGVTFVGVVPTDVHLADGRRVVVDTSGVFTSVEGMPAGSVLLTNRFLELKTDRGVRRITFDSLHASTALVITPKNARALKNQVLALTVALLAASGLVIVFVLGLLLATLGAGCVLLLRTLSRTAIGPRAAFALAVYALTPVTVVLTVVVAAGVFSGSFFGILWAGYCSLLGLAVLRVRGGAGSHET